MVPTTQAMAASARDKVQSMWTTIRSMTGGDNSRETSTGGNQESPMEGDPSETTLEIVIRSMFGSCTTGVTAAPEATYSKTRKNPRVQEPPSRRTDESFYSPYHTGDAHVRAAKAVHSLRESMMRSPSASPTRSCSPNVPKPFPASSPRASTVPLPEVPALTPERKGLRSAGSFDDGISAISAHTLEEMARHDELKHQRSLNPVRSDLTTDSALFRPSRQPSRSSDLEEARDAVGVPMSPFTLAKGRSYGTWASKGSRGAKSIGTKSTQSSQSSEFEHVWRQHEERYWQDVVEEEGDVVISKETARHYDMLKKARDLRSRSGSRELDVHQDPTSTTASSSMNSGWNSSFSSRHPHDTVHLDGPDFVPKLANRRIRDPDRIRGVLLLDHDAEVGEI